MMLRMIGLLALVALIPLTGMAKDEEGPAMARIITQNEKPPQCLSRVHIQRIDGELVNVHPSGFDIEPGMHSMNGRATVNTSFCRRVSGRTSEGIPDLEAEFEAGKTYYIGLDHRSRNSEDWRLVIWKVEPEEGEDGERG
jgi:hypothetical protein